jgi:signal transduction histidine kinase
LEQAEKIELSYDQNMLAFDFAAIHYSSPENNRHLYQLGNYDAEWREVGMEKSAYYFNVPPGNYVFRIKAASSEGKWAEKAIAVVIHPPWWRTWWAYSVYGICFLAGVFFLNHIQRQQLIQRERERTREKELAQAKEIEKAYHELRRTQAQLIQQELLKSQIEIQEQTLKSVSEEIHDNVGQVLSLLKLNISMMNPYESKDLDEKITDSKQLVSKAILDLRRLSKSLNTDYISEVGLIPSIELELEQIKKVGKYKTELQISGQVLHLDKHKELILFRIFQEALNNIIKHAQATSIMVCLIYKENTLVMEIIDDGQGFDLAKSIEDCNGIKTGIGIKSIQNRANLLGANFDIQSSTGKGTRININLPI